MNKEETRFKSIVGDPYASEAQWLPACAMVSDHSISVGTEAKPLLAKFGIFCLTLSCCYIAAFAFTKAVDIGYDWGYHLVDKVIGQTHRDNQGIIANVSLAFGILPLSFGMFFGSTIAKNRSWRFWMPLGIFLSFASSALACIAVDSWSFFLQTITNREFWFYDASIFTMGIVGLSIGKQVALAIDKKFHIKPVLAAMSLQAAIFGSLLCFHGHTIKPIVEVLVYAAALFWSSLLCSYLSKPRDKFNAIAFPALAAIPIIVANFFNVLMNVVSLSLDQISFGLELGVQALLSSILISTLAAISIAAGGLSGQQLCKLRSRR